MWARRVAVAALCTAVVALAAMALAADRVFPPDLSRLRPSPLVEDRHGVMLRAFPTADGQWRLPVDPASVSPNYLRLLVAIEDKRFWHHRGVDPLALLRAAWQDATRGRIVSGGSTLTMQVVRLLEPRPRTLRSKLIEAFRAVQIEARMSKAEILRAYLTLTPMGGDLEGVRAGSLAWFGKEPRLLSDPEAALLVALPQAPRSARPDAHPARARLARDRVLALAVDAGVLDPASARTSREAALPLRRHRLPFLAPHLAERLLAADPARTGPIRTALDARLQGDLERVLRDTLNDLPSPVNLAAIIADWHTGEVLARAGSGAYRDARRHGMVDMTLAVRSPGSALKPFVYGMAFDGLLAHPASLVRDAPTRFDDYAPRNFDGGFDGDVTVRRALQASLNLPAVIVLQRLGPVAFVDRFREAGLPLAFAAPDVAPSLPVVLGGVGLTLERLVTAYAALADGGTLKPLVERLGSGPPGEPRGTLMRRAAADAVVDILAGVPPPHGFASRTGPIAYKTGTSFRFRDGWAIGFDGDRVIGVWMGRADGASCAGCVGAASAAILFRLFDLLPPRPLPARSLAPVFAGPPPAALARLGPAASAPQIEGTLTGAPHIAFPLAGSRLLVDATAPEVRMAVEGGTRPYRWIVDGRAVPSLPFSRDAAWHPSEGFATVTVVDAHGHSDEVHVRIVDRTDESASR
jgi:penicillin-binding protein 1C